MSHVGSGGTWKAFVGGASGNGCAVGVSGSWKSIEGMWVGEGGVWKPFFTSAFVMQSGTITRGTNGSGWNGFTAIVSINSPFGDLLNRFFSFAGTTYEIVDWSTGRLTAGQLGLRLGGGTSASRATAWDAIQCSLGTFRREDATESDSGSFSDYTWAGAGSFPTSGTEDVSVLRDQ